jgi:hypothetical protein
VRCVVTVVFYISGHGFGHASREVEVINALGARRPDARIIVRSAVPPDLLRRTLRVPVELRPGACDTGIVQSSSVAHDLDATVAQALAFHATLDDRADAEARALGPGVTVVVGDIPPLAFEVAARLHVPSIAIGNFTWDWIYDGYEEFAREPWFGPRLRAAYAHAMLALATPLSAGFEIFRTVRPIPLIARRPARARTETRAHFGIPLDRPAALLSFGGYGLPDLDLARLDCLDDWTVVTTDRVTPPAAPGSTATSAIVSIPETRFDPHGVRYEDLVAAVDVVMTKPGYGIIAECIAARTAMLYTSRGAFREYEMLVAALPRYLRSRFLSQQDLFAGRWRLALQALIAQPAPPETLPTDGADVAAEAILGVDGTTL